VPEPYRPSPAPSAMAGSSSNHRRHDGLQSPPSQPPPDVIDLTDSPAQGAALPYPPRPTARSNRSTPQDQRVIIDLDALPDVQSLPPPPARPQPRHVQQQRRRRAPYIIPAEDVTRNADVVMLGQSALPERSFPLPNIFNMIRNRYFPQAGASDPSQPPNGIQTHYHYHYHGQPTPRTGGFQPPGRLNYGMRAAHLFPVDPHENDDSPLRDHPIFKDDSYVAPPTAKDGYTRSPTENMVLICPSCAVELGKDVDVVKKQVWAAKCGHVYCGECAAAQRMNKAKGAKVGRCFVEGCNKIISGDRAMIEVFP